MAELAALCRVNDLEESNPILTGRYRSMTDRIEEERTSPQLAVMTRAQVVDELTNFPGVVRLDFTEEFVTNQSLDQLKHILAAARMHLSLKSNEMNYAPAN